MFLKERNNREDFLKELAEDRLLGATGTEEHNAEYTLSEQLSHSGENHITKNERFS